MEPVMQLAHKLREAGDSNVSQTINSETVPEIFQYKIY